MRQKYLFRMIIIWSHVFIKVFSAVGDEEGEDEVVGELESEETEVTEEDKTVPKEGAEAGAPKEEQAQLTDDPVIMILLIIGIAALSTCYAYFSYRVGKKILRNYKTKQEENRKAVIRGVEKITAQYG